MRIPALITCASLIAVLGVVALRTVDAGEDPPVITVIEPPHVEAPPHDVAAAAAGAASPAISPNGLDPYRGMGAWIDLYDYVLRGRMDAGLIAADLERRGVRTLYLQTSRWNLPVDILDPAATGQLIEQAHARNIRVVGWYLPGFADIERDVRSSLAVLTFRTPGGHMFDGFAADIEDPRAVGNNAAVFNNGVAQYSIRLRATAPPGVILGAIVPDAKNNLRAPGMWAGFPWMEIGRNFDVVMPMAYWSVIKGRCGAGLNAESYMREVMALTRSAMGTPKPMHPIGGIADCTTAQEIAQYVNVGLADGWLGGSIYDVLTTNASPWGETMWGELRRFNP